MGIREEQKEQRRQDILEAGLELFVAKGYAGTKITDIADRVSMSTGLLFHYFESKEKLYEELVKTGLQGTRYPAQMECSSAIGFFEGFARQLLMYIKEQPVAAKMFSLMAQAQRSEGIPEHIKQMAEQVDTIEQFVPIILRGQEEGTVREGDALALSNVFWCSVQGIMEQFAVRPEIPLPEPEWIVDIVRKAKEC